MEKVFKMKFWAIYDALLNKMRKKNRQKEELDEVISWLTGYRESDIERCYENKELTYEEFFAGSPKMNPNRGEVKGKICGVDIQAIENEMARDMRILDKLVDELAKGKTMDKVLMRATEPQKVAKSSASEKKYEYDATITPVPDKGGAYVIFPWDIKQEFGKGRVKVHATFDGEPYDGSVVNMGVTNEDGSVCYIIGIRKEIQKKIGKSAGDSVRVVISERE